MSIRSDTNDLTPGMPEADRRLMGLLQDLPLTAEPWRMVAQRADIDQPSLLNKLAQWRTTSRLRHVRAFFNTRRLGCRSTLAAAAVRPDQADRLAALITARPEVSHNSLREGADLNLWFTLTCPPAGPTPDQVLTELSQAIAQPIRAFDATKHYKISFDGLFPASDDWPTPSPPKRTPPIAQLRTALALLQDDLPLCPQPFAELAKQNGMTQDDLLQAAIILKHHGLIRRIGALWNFAKLTANRNVMTLWNAPADRLDALGRHLAECPRVSHCYQRRTHTDWPWPIYAMLHGAGRDDCLRQIDELAAPFTDAEHLELWTVREYKQSPVRLDADKIDLKLLDSDSDADV